MNPGDLVPGMVVGHGGKFAIQLDKENPHYGWLFERMPCGWVSLRKALDVEMEAAQRQVKYNDFFRSLNLTHTIH